MRFTSLELLVSVVAEDLGFSRYDFAVIKREDTDGYIIVGPHLEQCAIVQRAINKLLIQDTKVGKILYGKKKEDSSSR